MKHNMMRTGIIGLGRIGWNYHAKEISCHSEYDLIAVSDQDKDKLAEARKKYNCSCFDNHRQMIKESNLDVVVIASPTHTHFQMAMNLLEAGIHVIIEKPMAMNYQEAFKIFELAEKNNCLITVFQPRRLAAYFQQILTIIEKNVIGDIFWVQLAHFDYCRRNDWQSLSKYGGGMLRNYGSHFIDQLLQLIGYDIINTYCYANKYISLGDADDIVKIVLQTETNKLGEITINQASLIKPYELYIWGNKGSIKYSDGQITIEYFDTIDSEIVLEDTLNRNDRIYPKDNIKSNLEIINVDSKQEKNVYTNFADAINQKDKLIVPVKQTLEVVKTIDNCIETSSFYNV